jgi:hypothetical protein
MSFTVSYHWSARPVPLPEDDSFLAGHDPVWVALVRFNARNHGEFTVPLDGGELTFWFEDDLANVFERLPDWLGGVAGADGEASLQFGSQGAELRLDADRRGETVTLSAESLSPDAPLLPSLRPLTMPVGEFLAGWGRFLRAVLDALSGVDPALRDDPGYRRYLGVVQQWAC